MILFITYTFNSSGEQIDGRTHQCADRDELLREITKVISTNALGVRVVFDIAFPTAELN